jgi:tetratricopeptide (TPR) repeat protein
MLASIRRHYRTAMIEGSILCFLIFGGQENCSAASETQKAKELFEAGQMLEFNGNPEAARQAYEKSVVLDDHLKDSHEALAHLYANQGFFLEAAKQLQKVIQISPTELSPYLDLATLLRKAHQTKAAVQVLEIATALPHKDQQVERELGFLYLENGENGKAEEIFQKLSNLQPEVVDYHLGLAISRFRLGKPNLADDSIRSVLTLNPNEPNAYCLEGDLELSRGNQEASIRAYRRAIAAQPTLAQAYLSLGDLLLSENRLAEAHEVLEKGKTNCPGQEDLLLALAIVLERQSQNREAAKVLEQASGLEDDLRQKEAIQKQITTLKDSTESGH